MRFQSCWCGTRSYFRTLSDHFTIPQLDSRRPMRLKILAASLSATPDTLHPVSSAFDVMEVMKPADWNCHVLMHSLIKLGPQAARQLYVTGDHRVEWEDGGLAWSLRCVVVCSPLSWEIIRTDLLIKSEKLWTVHIGPPSHFREK
jgi:hypothetical protein